MLFNVQHTQGASVNNVNDHPMFGETNWENNGPDRAYMSNGDEALANIIYCDSEILDPIPSLFKAEEEKMETILQIPITKEAATLATTNVDSSGTTGVTNPVGNDSSAFIQALTGGFKQVLKNTSGEGKRSQKKKTVDRYSKTWQLMRSTESTGMASGKVTTPGVL